MLFQSEKLNVIVVELPIKSHCKECLLLGRPTERH